MAGLRHHGALTRRPGRFVAATALFALLAGSALCVVFAIRLEHGRQVLRARQQALAAAEQVALAVTTYDHRDPQRSRRFVEAHATGAFRHDFAAASPQFYATVAAQQASATGTLRAAGVVSADATTATVVAAVDQRVRSAARAMPSKQPPSSQGLLNRRLRLELRLERHHGDWLVAGLRER